MPEQESFADELGQAIRDAALDVLGPAVRQATISAANLAVSKAPGLIANHVLRTDGDSGLEGLSDRVRSAAAEALGGMGGTAGIAGKLLSRIGGGGRDAPTGYGRGRRMPVQQVVFVSVPVRHAYLGWTEYKQWPRYMHRANQVDPRIDDKEARLRVTEKMWGFTRPFTAEVVTQQPYERIKWTSAEGPRHTGVINFHELGPRLTLVEVNLDHWPSGPVEKFARGARFVKRAVRADFHRFRGWIEMKDDDELEALEGWRGTIEDGRIVTSHEDALERGRREEERLQQHGRGARAEKPEGAKEEKPAATGDQKGRASGRGQAEAQMRSARTTPRGRGSRQHGGDGAVPAPRKRPAPRSTDR